MKWIFSILLVLLTLAGTPASAQWSKRLDPAVPRTREGKLDLAARPPRARDGKADLSGVWLPLPDPAGKPQNVENIVVPRYFTDVMADLKLVRCSRLVLVPVRELERWLDENAALTIDAA